MTDRKSTLNGQLLKIIKPFLQIRHFEIKIISTFKLTKLKVQIISFQIIQTVGIFGVSGTYNPNSECKTTMCIMELLGIETQQFCE